MNLISTVIKKFRDEFTFVDDNGTRKLSHFRARDLTPDTPLFPDRDPVVEDLEQFINTHMNNPKKQELLDKIEELKQQVEKLELSEQDEWFEPKEGEVYWINDPTQTRRWVMNPDSIDVDALERQQVFRTYEEAELADRKRIAETNIKRFIAKNGYGVKKEDWENERQSKYRIYYDHTCEKFRSTDQYTCQIMGAAYVNSQEAFEHLIREHEADLKLLMDIE